MTTMTINKFREIANRMDSQIEDKLRDRQENTAKRQCEAASARLEGWRLQRTQAALRGLANLYQAGQVPMPLTGFTTKKSVYEAMGAEIQSSGGYYDAGVETGEPRRKDEATRILWEFVKDRTTTDSKGEALRQKINGLQFAKIPGYFPTPQAVIELMIEKANIREGMTVLEPSAGSGNIYSYLMNHVPDINLACYEINFTLQEILKAQGYQVLGEDGDFLKAGPYKWERIIMNPPFENFQDIDHVMKAYDSLFPGGRLVAIMSPGPFFNQRCKADLFRKWFDEVGGEVEDLPKNSFKESGTGVASKIVVIDKN